MLLCSTMLFLITVGLFITSVTLWIRWRIKKFSIFKEMGIPGPEPNIFFGNVLELFRKDPVVCQNEWIKRYGDVVGYFYGSLPILLVTRVDMMRQIFIKDFSTFSDRPRNFYGTELDSASDPSGEHMSNATGKRWKILRSLLAPAFTSGKLKKMMPLLQDSTSLVLSKIGKASNNGTKDVEIYNLYQGMTLDAIGRAAFGIDAPVQNDPNHPIIRSARMAFSYQLNSYINFILVGFREFRIITHGLSKLLASFYNKGTHPLGELFAICGDIVNARRTNPSLRRPDLLQTLIDARSSGDISDKTLVAESMEETKESERTDENLNGVGKKEKDVVKLNDMEIQANALMYFTAGSETTSTAMAFMTHSLINNQGVQDEMRKEIFDTFGNEDNVDYDLLPKLQYTDRCIMEALRMNPPVFMFLNRVANRATQLGELSIPKGLTVQVPVHYVHHNPELYPDPHKFDPDRFLPENRSKDHSVIWLPFGAGPRNCIGIRFALVEMKIILVKMLRKYRLEACGKSEIGDIKLDYSVFLDRPANGIYVRAIPL